ncbi:hypothetical protein [Rubrivirga marina]|uniref:Lipoprotein n=1 Tax=Rubrivirga marina TaxID=1196024 RepID=A0A271J1A3_9BACT|nr:hypothetical protein [Rubrivirga marina]PAP77272.1 hypothetical protein BSZ37_12920 [Rubrivirga marina]
MNLRNAASTVLLALALTSCDSGGLDASAEAAALSGNWISTQSAQVDQHPDLDLDLQFSADGTVSGSGTLAKTPARIGDPITTYLDLVIEGTWTSDRFTLDVTRRLYAPSFAYTLTVNRASCPDQSGSPVGTYCEASMTGSGQFANPSFTFFNTLD